MAGRSAPTGFSAALLPAVVMLWLAIDKRVAQYGITERRGSRCTGELFLRLR